MSADQSLGLGHGFVKACGWSWETSCGKWFGLGIAEVISWESDVEVRFGLRSRPEWRERGWNCEKIGLVDS